MKTRFLSMLVMAIVCTSFGWAVRGGAAKEGAAQESADHEMVTRRTSDEDAVKEMMEAAHKGPQSPLAIVKAQVVLDRPDWTVLAKNTLPLAELAAAIKDNQTYTSRPGPYVAAVKALGTAAEQHDVEDARAAVHRLTQSCAGCHRDG